MSANGIVTEMMATRQVRRSHLGSNCRCAVNRNQLCSIGSNDSGIGEELDFSQADIYNRRLSVSNFGAYSPNPPVRTTSINVAKVTKPSSVDCKVQVSKVYTLRLTPVPSLNVTSVSRIGAAELLACILQRSQQCNVPILHLPIFFEATYHIKLANPQPSMPATLRNSGNQCSKQLQMHLQQQRPTHLPHIALKRNLLIPGATLGKGHFGQVFVCNVKKQDSCDVSGLSSTGVRALKATYNLNTHNIERAVHMQLQKNRTEKDYSSTFILWMVADAKFVFEGREVGCLLLELATGGSLQDLVNNLHKVNRRLTEREALFYLCELGCALDYLHSHNLLHLDIKADNVLISAEGHVRVADLGHSLRLRDGKATTRLQAGLSTYHLPVEILREATNESGEKLVTMATDWFSYGCMAFWLLHNYYPIAPPIQICTPSQFADYMATVGYTELNKAFVYPISVNYRAMVCKLLHPEPHKRLGAQLGFQQLLQHSSSLFAESGLFPKPTHPQQMRAIIEASALMPPFLPLPTT